MTEQGRRVPPTARIAEYPKNAADQARWWEGHILEVLHGLPPDAPQGAVPRPEFDPRLHSLAERERAKAAELTAAGHRMTASGVKQRRQRYRRDGLVGRGCQLGCVRSVLCSVGSDSCRGYCLLMLVRVGVGRRSGS